jgi:RHS repeat-associated protein
LPCAASGSTYYYFQDGLGSVRNVVDSSEVAQNTYDHYPFGNIFAAQTENVTNPYRFTGREHEAGSLGNMHYYRNRYYMAYLGIFASRDAMWADIHQGWGYVGNSPTMLVDPLGLKVVQIEIVYWNTTKYNYITPMSLRQMKRIFDNCFATLTTDTVNITWKKTQWKDEDLGWNDDHSVLTIGIGDTLRDMKLGALASGGGFPDTPRVNLNPEAIYAAVQARRNKNAPVRINIAIANILAHEIGWENLASPNGLGHPETDDPLVVEAYGMPTRERWSQLGKFLPETCEKIKGALGVE